MINLHDIKESCTKGKHRWDATGIPAMVSGGFATKCLRCGKTKRFEEPESSDFFSRTVYSGWETTSVDNTPWTNWSSNVLRWVYGPLSNNPANDNGTLRGATPEESNLYHLDTDLR